MIYLVGLGPGDATRLPPQAFSLLTGSLPVFLRTARHPTLVQSPLKEALAVKSVTALDDEYENNASFDDTYDAIVARVLRAAAQDTNIVYAVPGHPLIGETTGARLLERAKQQGVAVKVVGAPSFVDACLEAMNVAVTGDLHVLDALSLAPASPTPLPELTTGGPLLLYQVHSRAAASQAKLALMNAGYPDEWEVTVIRSAGIPGAEAVFTTPLYRLDRDSEHDHLTSVWVPALPLGQRPADFGTLVGLMARLRDPNGGCPWDLEQTHQSLRRYVLEEAYEVAEVIDKLDAEDGPEKLADELGDLLLQVVFHAQLGAEDGTFDVKDVCAAICDKLIRRHPHVFGDVKVEDSQAVLKNWQQIKATEKGHEARKSLLDGIPQSLPGLMIALETSRRVVKVGFEWPELEQILAKVDEELGELRAEIDALGEMTPARLTRIEGELGDVLFTLVNVGRRLGVDAEAALRKQVIRFSKRFQFIEQAAATQGLPVSSLTLEQMEMLWQEAKQVESAATVP